MHECYHVPPLFLAKDSNDLAWFVVRCIRAVMLTRPSWLILENPSNSFLWQVPPLAELMQLVVTYSA